MPMPFGTDYRQLEGPAQVDTNLPDSGAAARAAALGSVFKEFEGVSDEFGHKIFAQQGALAGAAAGSTGHPEYKEGLNRFSAYSQAFNNAATGAYAVQAEAQADDTAARLRVEANNDPSHFAATYSAVRDAVLKTAPAQAVPMLTELYNKHLAAGMAAISGDLAAQTQQTQRATYDEGIARQTSRVADLQGRPDPQAQLAAEDEHTKLSLMIDGGVKAGLYSPVEAKAMQIGAMRLITSQVFSTQVDHELARPDGDVVTLLDNFRKAHEANLADTTTPPILSEPEYQKLMADATTKIREQNMLVSMNKRDGKTAEQLKFEAGDKQYTSLLFKGQLTDHLLDLATTNGDLKPETARALHSQLLQGDQSPKSNPAALYRVHNDPNFLDMTADDVAKLPGGAGGINYTDKLKLIDEIDKRKNSWEGTQNVKQAKGAISAALKIPPGTQMAALSDEQRRALIDANQDFIGRMNALEPAKRDGAAASVAQEVVKAAAQRGAAADAAALSTARQNFIKSFGPGGSASLPDEKYQQRLKTYDQRISAAQAAAKGQ